MLLNTDWESFGGSTEQAMSKSISEIVPAFCGMLFSIHEYPLYSPG